MDNLVITQIDTNPNTVTNLNFKDSHQMESQAAHFLQESQQFLSLLPKEVWDHICGFLDSKAFQNLNNSSPFFLELFLRKRTFLLLEPVLEILLPKLGTYTEPPPSTHHQVRNARSLLLNSRLVCKTWKSTIDNMACIWDEDKHNKYYSVHHFLSVKNKFNKIWEIEKFRQHFEPTHSSNVNPIPAKHISVQIKLGETRQSKGITNLLEKYGKHLRTFNIGIHFGNENPPELQHKIMGWLNFVPNLQNLRVYYLFQMGSNSVSETQQENVPPKFKFLRNLVVTTFTLSFKDVDIPDWSWLERYHLSNLIRQHENLDLLNVMIFNRKDVETLKNVTSPLKKLGVQFNCKEDDVKMSEMFTMLPEQFSGSLKELDLSFRVNNVSSAHMKMIRDSFYGRLNLPKLRKLEIKILSVFCVDFLLGMEGKNLEELTVSCVSGCPRYYENSGFSEEQGTEIGEMEGKQIIEFLGYQDKILESNIWRIFPKLRNICLDTFSGKEKEFSRRDWVKAQKLM